MPLRAGRPPRSAASPHRPARTPTGRRSRVDPGSVVVHQQHLEGSNVDPVGSLVEMIEVQRAYSAIQRSMTAIDGVMGRITNDIGRVR